VLEEEEGEVLETHPITVEVLVDQVVAQVARKLL
jgi:hypothetical protein